MNKEFVPYEEALELKELGFNEPCFGEYRQWNGCRPWLQIYQDGEGAESSFTTECKAPTFSQAFRFFREKGYDVNVQKESEGVYFGFYWSGVAWVIVGKGTYEDAELNCLRKLIEISKNK